MADQDYQYWVQVINGEVKQCLDSKPIDADETWLPAIEVKPVITDNIKQCYKQHYFDTTETPVKIVWPVHDNTEEEIIANAAYAKSFEDAIAARKTQEALNNNGNLGITDNTTA